MHRRASIVAALLLYLPTLAVAEELVSDPFDGPLDEDLWCACQIWQDKTPVEFSHDKSDMTTFATVHVDESSVGGKDCKPKCKLKLETVAKAAPGEIELPDNLGPPLQSMLPKTKLEAKVDYCTDEVRERGRLADQDDDDCSQRQELRFHSHLKFRSDYEQSYAFRFRMPLDVLDKQNSIRWITAQWKQEPFLESDYTESLKIDGPSPIVAQRYDDGVLRVTVQSDLCRCVVAADVAPTDIQGLESDKWKVPQDCITIDERTTGGECTPDLKAVYENGGALTSPFETWVDMKYVMRVTGGHDSYLEIYQNDKRIVRLEGTIGYKPDPKNASMTKFKIGIYRDYIPQRDRLDVDWLKVDVSKP